MPGIELTVSGTPDEALNRRLATELTALTCETLRKEPERTMVMIHHVPHKQWFINTRSLADQGKNSFRLEVTITEDSNTRDEKEAYQKRVFALLAELIGNVHPHSNVHIVDCKGSAYGYGGITQERRFHAQGTPA